MISIRNITKDYGTGPILENVSLDIEKGESVVIIGGSGCGKSTLLRCINRLIVPESGGSAGGALSGRAECEAAEQLCGVRLQPSRRGRLGGPHPDVIRRTMLSGVILSGIQNVHTLPFRGGGMDVALLLNISLCVAVGLPLSILFQNAPGNNPNGFFPLLFRRNQGFTVTLLNAVGTELRVISALDNVLDHMRRGVSEILLILLHVEHAVFRAVNKHR